MMTECSFLGELSLILYVVFI